MSANRQSGMVSGSFISLIVVTLLLVGSLAFGVWAFMERQDYKENSDEKAAAAAQQAKEETQTEEAAKYAEEAKSPLKTFTGPASFGKVTMQYPKTWSAYVIEETESGSMPLDGYFHPDVVPDVSDDANSYALRMQIVEDTYDNVLSEFDDSAENGEVTVAPYKLPKVQDVVGSRIDGVIATDKKGSMVILPLRNVTLKVWTEAEQYVPDFDTYILPNLSFSP